MQVQIRRFLPDGETPQEVIDTARVRVADGVSSSSVLTFTVSVAVADGIRQWMDDNPGKPFAVGLERSDGADWVEPRNGRFVAYKGTADDLDPTGSVQITCMDFVTWDLLGTYLHWSQYAKDGEREWTETGLPASAGTIIGGMIVESKARGWAPGLLTDFTWDKDSAGANWTAAEKVLQGWRLLTPLSQVLSSLVDQGLCEWWAEGRMLRLFRPGAGVLRENVVLGGEGFTRAPGSWDYSNVFTDLTVVPEKAQNWLYLPNPGADASTGRREATVSQSGVKDHATATKMAQSTLLGGRTAKREQSYEWPVVEGMPQPWADFQVGDTVKILTTVGERLERVVELAVSVDEDGVVTAHAVTGDLMRSKASQRNQNTDNATLGGLVGGSGSPLPVTSPPALSDPLAPTGLHVASNVGSWREGGTAQAAVTIEWDAVSQTVDGSAVDIAGYEVAVRTPESESAIFATLEALAVTTTDWEPGKERLVKVRALDHRGQVSAWSGEISVTPEMPLSIIPKAPTGLAVKSNTAVFQADNSAVATIVFGWNAVTQSIDNTLVDVVEYEVQHGLSTQRVSALEASITLPTTKQGTVRVRALTSLGVWGDPSAPLVVTGAAPAVSLPAPSLTVVGGMGGVVVSWDGKLGGANVPAGFARTVLEVASAVAGPFTVQAVPWTSAGSQSVAAPVGETRWVRARAYDTLGRSGTYSAAVSAVALGVPISEIPGLDGELSDIRYTADGKNRIYVSATSPGADFAPGDQWWVVDPDGVSLTGVRMWNGTQWVSHVIVAEHVIATGSITGTLIKAGTIYVDNLHPSVGESLNLFANEAFNVLIGRSNAADAHLTTLDGQVSGAQTAADAAQSDANAAANAASTVGNRLDEHQTHYRFGAGGLSIGVPSGATELRLKPDPKIELVVQGVVGASLSESVLTVPEAKLEKAVIAGLRVEGDGNGGTLFMLFKE